MEKKDKIFLPKEFRETPLTPCLSVSDAREILSNYCVSCVKNPDCDSYQGLASSLKEGYGYWHNLFGAVDVKLDPDIPFSVIKRIYCTGYQPPQFNLPEIPRTFNGGIERLMKILQEEKASFER
ncbi:hypothetical protein FJZ20_01840 [Candidatus Pacearchaeota archaeon]|nr:hypothetical protein [Candidatus Pacearchaeota archaeon]